MVFASLASIGIPSKYATMTGPDLEKWTQTRAGDALGQLKTAMFLAGVAGLLVVSLSTWILVASANKAPDPSTVHAIVIAKGGAQCGELVNTDKGLQLKIGDSVTPIGKDATVTVVTTCP
jgi:hypothetical protein